MVEDEVARMIPNSIVQANSSSASPPNSARGSVARNVASEVPIVRESVSLIDRSIRSPWSSTYICAGSRARSYTTTLSLIEYPMTVSKAAIATRLN